MSDQDDLLPSTTILPELRSHFPDAVMPLHRQLMELVRSGAVPAERVRGRWYFRRTDLPVVAAALGLGTTRAAA